MTCRRSFSYISVECAEWKSSGEYVFFVNSDERTELLQDPDEFRPERFDDESAHETFAYLPFSAGAST